MKDVTRAEYKRIREVHGNVAGPVFDLRDVEALTESAVTIRRGLAPRQAELELRALLRELRATAWLVQKTDSRLTTLGALALPAFKPFSESTARRAAEKYDLESGSGIWRP